MLGCGAEKKMGEDVDFVWVKEHRMVVKMMVKTVVVRGKEKWIGK